MTLGIVYGLNAGGGFFSTFFFLCKAYLTARSLRIPFYVDNVSWPYTFEKGWHDYMRTIEVVPKFSPMYFRRVTHNTQSKEPEFRLIDYQAACHELFKLRADLMDRVRSILHDMNGNFIAVFVRRGDKLNEEAKYISVKDILNTIPHTEDTRFFVQTDDYTVVEEFRELHNPKLVVSKVPEYKRGQYLTRQHWNMDNGKNPHIHQIIPILEQPKTQIKQETEEMLIGLSVCYMAPQCWTDSTSNVGRFLKLMSPGTVHFYPEDVSVNMEQVHCPAVNFPSDR
jgi:hypothetical protein